MPSSSERVRFGRANARVLGAFVEGWRRVVRAPAITLGVFAMTALVALPFAWIVDESIQADLGSSAAASRLERGWDPDWATEFSSRSTGISRTFTHEILGFGGTLAPLSRLLEGTRPPTPVVAAIAAYLALWLFLSGGILDRLARARPVRTGAFFSACGTYFVRFVRLGVLTAAAYFAIFAWLRPWLFDTIYHRLTRDATTESYGITVRVLIYAVLLLVLMTVSVIADFAKVRAVVEDRRSMLGALLASVRFVRRRVLRVAGLYVVNILAILVIGRLWLQIAPGGAPPLWVSLLAGQVYLVIRLWAKLSFMASEVVFFQGELAHAQYTALPEPRWPDSPAVEAVRNLAKRDA